MQYWNGHLTVSILNVNSVITFAYEHRTILILLNQFNGEKIIPWVVGDLMVDEKTMLVLRVKFSPENRVNHVFNKSTVFKLSVTLIRWLMYI